MNLLYIPAVLLMACFVLYPLARGIYISFFKWNGYSQNMTFIGLKNYLSLLSDKYFKSSFWNTMLYGVHPTPAGKSVKQISRYNAGPYSA